MESLDGLHEMVGGDLLLEYVFVRVVSRMEWDVPGSKVWKGMGDSVFCCDMDHLGSLEI